MSHNCCLFFLPLGRYIATPYSAKLIESVGLTVLGSLFSHLPQLHNERRYTFRFPYLADSISSQDSSQLPGHGEGDWAWPGRLHISHASFALIVASRTLFTDLAF